MFLHGCGIIFCAGGRISVPALVVTTVLMLRAYRIGYGQSIFREYRINAVILAVTGCVMAACIFYLGNRKTPADHCKGRKVAAGILAAALLVNVISEGGISYVDRVVLKNQMFRQSSLQKHWRSMRTLLDQKIPRKKAGQLFISRRDILQNYTGRIFRMP